MLRKYQQLKQYIQKRSAKKAYLTSITFSKKLINKLWWVKLYMKQYIQKQSDKKTYLTNTITVKNKSQSDMGIFSHLIFIFESPIIMKSALVVRFVKLWRHHYWWRHSRKNGYLMRTAKSGVNIIRFLSKFQNILFLVWFVAVKFLVKIQCYLRLISWYAWHGQFFLVWRHQ